MTKLHITVQGVVYEVDVEVASKPAEAPAGPSPELLAVLAAAVHATLNKPQVTRVRYRTNPGEIGWSIQGRVSIMAGHQVRRGR